MTRKSGIAIIKVSDFNGDAAQQLREYRLSINQHHILVYAAGSKQPIQGATVKVGGKAYSRKIDKYIRSNTVTVHYAQDGQYWIELAELD